VCRVLWQNRGACSFLKIEIQQNQSVTSLGSKLLDTKNVVNFIALDFMAK
jgi:hypothetical protein